MLNIYTGKDKIDLASLYKNIVPCITDWEDLGVYLGLQPHELDCISKDNEYTPNRTRNCCKAVLKKWLELECSPTWGKIEDAINAIENLLTTNNDITGKCLIINHKL